MLNLLDCEIRDTLTLPYITQYVTKYSTNYAIHIPVLYKAAGMADPHMHNRLDSLTIGKAEP